MSSTLQPYIELVRLNKPIGILLLLWPTWWALWLAAHGLPPLSVLFIFTAGVLLMRSAGCAVNDLLDRKFDRHVTRTRLRPLAAGTLSVKQALVVIAVLASLAFALVLFCNPLTIYLSFAGAIFAATYPLLKRMTHLPQLGLGIAFSWGVPMAFAAVTGMLDKSAWWVFATAALWPVIYDTMYAMTDRADDVKVGVKSTAILFGQHDLFILTVLSCVFIAMLFVIGILFQLNYFYDASLCIVAILLRSQLAMIKERDPQECFQAFLNNNYVGLCIFIGMVVGLYK